MYTFHYTHRNNPAARRDWRGHHDARKCSITAQGAEECRGTRILTCILQVISIYTFLGIWIGRNIRSLRKTAYVMAAAWSFVIFMVILGNEVNKGPGKHFESPTPVRQSRRAAVPCRWK